MQFKIIKCVRPAINTSQPEKIWYEVQILSYIKKFWFFGELQWITVRKGLDIMRFETENDARTYINDYKNERENVQTTRTVVWTFIS